MAKTVSVGCLLVLAFCPSLLVAQDALTAARWGTLVRLDGVQTDSLASGSVGAPDFGTLNWSAYSLVAHAFRPWSSEVTYALTGLGENFSIYRTNATGDVGFEAPIHLPTGALMTAFEFRFCDMSATRAFISALTINDKAGDLTAVTLVISTVFETPGCVNRAFIPATPIPVDNGSRAYSLQALLGQAGTSGSASIVLAQARIYYLLQVSPAPAVATFPLDVPTSHPFFRFIEALAASGVTAGCGPQRYCPDNPITRGEMAVFLAAALGLHFPN